MPESRTELGGLRKSAVVLLSLDDQRAGEILRRLPADMSRRLRAEAAGLLAEGQISHSARRAVLHEFLLGARALPVLPAPSRGLAELGRAGVEELLACLRDERPRTIALVLAHLPAETSAGVLAGLDGIKRLEVMNCSGASGPISSAVLERIESGLRRRLDAVMDRALDHPGDSAAAAILDSTIEAVDQHIDAESESVAALPQDDDANSSKDRSDAVLDHLAAASDADLRAVIEQVDSDTLLLALRGSDHQLQTRVLSNLVDDEAARIARKLGDGSATRLRDIESARQRLARAAVQIKAAGDIHSPVADSLKGVSCP